ncbi:hypothetical protein ACG3SL_02260 [Sphingomonas sp. CJ20]
MKKPNQSESSPFPDVFYPSPDTVCTEAFSHFLGEYHANLDFFFFVVQLVGRLDENRLTASKALLTTETDPVKRAYYEQSIAAPDATLDQLKKHSTVQSRNLTNGIVNAFQRYFSAIINAAALKRPELISSSQTVRIDDVLRFKKHKDLVSFIIDRKINDLSYGGLSDMEKYFSDRLGVRMFDNDRQKDLLRFFFEVRNINVHNGGVVNDLFSSRVKTVDGFPYTNGRALHVDMEALVALSDNAMRVAMRIDSAIGGKFGLQRKAHRSWKRMEKAANGKTAESKYQSDADQTDSKHT